MWYASVGVDADTERSLRSTGFTWLAEYSDFMGSRYKLEESYAPGEGGGPLYVDSWRVYRETAHDGWQSIWELLG